MFWALLNKFVPIVNIWPRLLLTFIWTILNLYSVPQPLEDSDKAELQSTLKLFAKKGENILLTSRVDPNIIGGMIVSIGDKYVDMSVASKIKKYTELLQTPA